MPAADRLFIDTNILVYAHDADAGERSVRARRWVGALWAADRHPCISVQVLQELYVNLRRKGLDASAAREVVQDYMDWDVVDADGSLVLQAIDVADRWQLSFWDGLIIAAARRGKADTIWTEDLNDGQDYGGVTVTNPFVREPTV